MKKMYGFTFEPSTIEALDHYRGDIPRSRIVERLIQERVGISSPSELAGHGDGEWSRTGDHMNIGYTRVNNYPLPLRVAQDTVDSIKKKYPLEGAILELMLLDGRAVLVGVSEWDPGELRLAPRNPYI